MNSFNNIAMMVEHVVLQGLINNSINNAVRMVEHVVLSGLINNSINNAVGMVEHVVLQGKTALIIILKIQFRSIF